MPLPVAAPRLTNPALLQAAAICSQGRLLRAEPVSGMVLACVGGAGLGLGDGAAVTAGWPEAGVLAADVTGADALGIGLGFLIAAGGGFAGGGWGESGGAATLGAVVPAAVGTGVAGALTAGASWLLGALTAAGAGCFSREAK